MPLMFILPGYLLLVAGLVAAKKVESIFGVWVTKPLASIGFVIVAVVAVQQWQLFQGLMLMGLVLCLVGDVLLIPASRTMFLLGLIAFLAGHLMYILAFSQVLEIQEALLLPLTLLTLVNLGIYYWLHRYLGTMRLAVVAYMIVISAMVLAAIGVYTNSAQPLLARMLVLTGALGFYVSDLFVVREQFVHKSFVNPLIGLPLYYGSQLALALSLADIQMK